MRLIIATKKMKKVSLTSNFRMTAESQFDKRLTSTVMILLLIGAATSPAWVNLAAASTTPDAEFSTTLPSTTEFSIPSTSPLPTTLVTEFTTTLPGKLLRLLLVIPVLRSRVCTSFNSSCAELYIELNDFLLIFPNSRAVLTTVNTAHT
jgi:hypothetical protein